MATQAPHRVIVLPPGLESAVVILASRSLTLATTAFHPLAVSGVPVTATDIVAFHAAKAAQTQTITERAPTEKSAPLAIDAWIFIV